MNSSAAALNLIEKFEGVRLKSYRCPAGVLTIGVGHTSAAGEPTVVENMTITRQEAFRILQRDLIRFEMDLNRLVKVPLSQNQYDALISFVFNIGAGAFAKSTLLKKLNAGRYGDVPAELMKWTKAGGKELPGLVKRRRAEAALWRSVDDKVDEDSEDSRVEPDAPKPAKTMAKSKEGNAAILTGGAAAISAASEVSRQVKETGDSLTTILDVVKDPVFIMLVLIVVAAGAIWYWRKQRLEETGE